jgi:hypothetical protein
MVTILKQKSFSMLMAAFFVTTISLAQAGKAVTDYLNVPGPIVLDNNSYSLSWSSHPAANFYKQEYIVKGDNPDKYKTMVLLDVITGQENIKDVVGAKIAELKKLKESNPVVNYEVINNPATGEYMLDFLMTANAPDGSITIIERNVYRYKIVADKSGQKAIMLFGVSTRAYGNAVDAFFTSLKSNRKTLMNSVAKTKMPEIVIKK